MRLDGFIACGIIYSMSTFYKVRKVGTKLFYDPKKRNSGLTFTTTGKRYDSLKCAQNAVDFCWCTTNTHWAPARPKKSVHCEVVQYIEHTLEIGTVSQDGKITLSLNQRMV